MKLLCFELEIFFALGRMSGAGWNTLPYKIENQSFSDISSKYLTVVARLI